MTINIGNISTVDEAFELITQLVKHSTETLSLHRDVVRAQLAGAKPSESELRAHLSDLEAALTGLARTQELVDKTKELRARLAATPDTKVQ